jgi:parvulin-like peptidyl-prolyl isomerase
MSRFPAALGGLALVLLVLAGCAPADPPIARVGGAVITAADFSAAATGNGRQYAPMGEAGKQVLVDDLVNRQLLIAAAKQLGFYADTAFLDYTKQTREQLQLQLLMRDLTGGEIEVSESEVHASYLAHRIEAHARVLFAPDRNTAREAELELAQGQDFAQVAERFNSLGMLPGGGDLGFLAPGALVPPLDDWLATAPVGKVMGPAEAKGQGWFFMRVEARRTAQLPPYPQVHDQLTQLLRQRKQRAWLMQNADWLKKAYGVRVLPGGAATFAGRIRAVASASPGAATSPLPELAPAEAAETIAEWSGGAYTLGDAWQAVQAPGQQPPNSSMVPMVERWIENQVFNRALTAEAEQRRLLDDPDPARLLRERLNNYLLQAYYTRAVLGAVTVTDEDLHAAFDRHAAELSTIESVDVLSLTLPESLTTEQFAMHVGHAATLTEAARAVGLEGAVKQTTVQFPSSDPMWSALETRFRSMRPGEYAGPFPAPGGQLVIQLVNKKEQPASWDRLTATNRQQLQSDVINVKRDERLRAVVDSLRHVIPISVDSLRVRHLSWPVEAFVPGLGQGG